MRGQGYGMREQVRLAVPRAIIDYCGFQHLRAMIDYCTCICGRLLTAVLAFACGYSDDAAKAVLPTAVRFLVW